MDCRLTPGIGHNSGRTAEPGQSWRTHAWRRARADLLPRLPVEVVRLRVRRAQELGLPYRTYAGVRATTGHDLVGFLFSSNALRILAEADRLPPDRADKLSAVAARRIGLMHAPAMRAAPPCQLDTRYAAPPFTDAWRAVRDRLKTVCRAEGVPADRLLVVGDTAVEAEWAEAMQAAGYIPAARYLAPDGAAAASGGS